MSTKFSVMIKVTYLSLVTLYLILMTGCSDLPKPFHRSASLPNVLTQPKGDNGVRVSLPLGTTKPMSKQIATAVVQALLERDIPATFGETGKLRYFLSARVESNDETKVLLPSRINWQLSRNDSAWHYNFYQDFDGSILESGVGSQIEIDNVGKNTANTIAKTLIPDDKTLTPVASNTHGLWLLPVKGKSKARVKALDRAIKYALKNAKVELSKTSSAAQFFLKGRISLNSIKYKSRLVRISWIITDRNGNPVGELLQQNTIPTKNFHKTWTEASLLIATAAAPSIKTLLNRSKIALNSNISEPNRALETNILDGVQPLLVPPSKFPTERRNH